MEKINRLVFILLLLLSSSLFSEELYINVTNVSTKAQLSFPYKKLKSMGLKMSYKKKPYGYAAYVGPYRSQENLQDIYLEVKKRFSNARIVIHRSSVKPKDEAKDNIIKHNDFILGAGIGYGRAFSTTALENGFIDIAQPKSSGLNYSIYGGYDFANGLSILANYMYLDTADLEFNNFYTSLNYRLINMGKLEPYFGLSVGYSALSWSTSPIVNASADSNNDSGDIMYGTQAGFTYGLFKNLYLKLDYSCLFLNHTTNIAQDTFTATLKHNTLHSLIAGLQYNF